MERLFEMEDFRARSPRPAAIFFRTFQSIAALSAFSTAAAPPRLKRTVRAASAASRAQKFHELRVVNGIHVRVRHLDLRSGGSSPPLPAGPDTDDCNRPAWRRKTVEINELPAVGGVHEQ